MSNQGVPVLNPVDIENRIREVSDDIARGVEICSVRYEAFLNADREFDLAYARAYMAWEGPAHEKRYAADLATEVERTNRDACDVAYKFADRRAKALENELRAYQSVGASVRAMYVVAGRGEGA
jgi:hypothetical protein